jgi:D-sedoheptulose 7-phosphate isomerase
MDFIEKHLDTACQIISQLDKKKIEILIESLVELRARKGRLFVLGVGGSAANASHVVNDFRKLAGIETYAPTDNISELTARTNDEGWETVFSGWLEVSNLNSRDALFILSVGGGSVEKQISVNLCKAIDLARANKSKIFGIIGREDSYTEEFADCCILVPPLDSQMITPHSESIQSVIWHLIVSHPLLRINSTKW